MEYSLSASSPISRPLKPLTWATPHLSNPQYLSYFKSAEVQSERPVVCGIKAKTSEAEQAENELLLHDARPGRLCKK